MKGASDPFSMVPQDPAEQWIPGSRVKKQELDVDDLSWLMNKAPLTLSEIINISLNNNPETKKSWADARIASAKYGQSMKDYYLLSEVDAQYLRTREAEFTSNFRSIIYETNYGAELRLNYLILDFGQRRATTQAALEALHSADFSHNRRIQETIQTSMDDYYNYLYSKELVRAGEQDVINAQIALDAVLEKFKTGIADVSDKVQATTRLLQEKLNVVERQKSEVNTYTTLANTMGLPANNFLAEVAGFPNEVTLFPIENLDCFVDKALDYRPDLLSAEASLRSAKQKVKAAEAERYPKFNGSFEIGRNYYNNGVNDHYDFAAQVDFSVPLFQGFYISNTIKLNKAKAERAQSELDQLKIKAMQEVTQYRSDAQF
ncbi:MAG: TolC family protein, partial [Simkaniaceae bacterium]|nr:TolC family protein [Simkaniaceae bacterium]